jgi:hypothetical protein
MERETTSEMTVRPFEPTRPFRTMLRISNLFMRPLLRSSAGKRIHGVALLCFHGQRTRRRYEVPVEYHELDGRPLILTASGWKSNLRGGADVELVHEGQRMPMRAELIEDPDEVAKTYEALIDRIGLDHANATTIGLTGIRDRMPPHEEIVEAVRGRRTVIRLGPR